MIEKYKLPIHIVIYSILLTTLTILALYSYSQSNTIEDKETKLVECSLLKANSDSNNVTLEAIIKDLNDKSLKDTIEAESRDKEYIKQITMLNKQSRKVGSNECEDVKIRINAIRGNDYTRMLK